MDIDLKQLRELMRSLKQFDITELVVEKDGERIKLRRGDHSVGAANMIQGSMMPMSMHSIAPPPANDIGTSTKEIAIEVDPNLVFVTSPFVGTFYRAASPDAPPFVNVGSTVRSGQVLCIVEAMKLMNEIESEVGGTIVEVLVENGKPVEYGDKLFRVRKS
ncbi:MAG: acetyl-CoA carboxylase biotin carboxyl carrier protein [Sandaracinaceae bacterium]|nr:acetyl-CoA carboxylase biotin carboxyl carrier protein [Sandaracinaceae bacterium]